MIPQPFDIVFGFFRYPMQESRIVRIRGTSKHKILPDEDSPLVGFFKEGIIFINASSPYTYHIHVRDLCIFQQTRITGTSHPRKQGIGRNQVGTFGKHRNTVYLKIETHSFFVLLLYHTYLPEPYLMTFLRNQLSIDPHRRFKLIQRRLSPAVGHPKMRGFYRQRKRYVILSWL